MEIINDAQVTPQRLRALVKLVIDLGTPTRQQIETLLQPPNLLSKLSQENSRSENPRLAVENTYKHAKDCNLIAELPDKRIKAQVAPEQVESMFAFQKLMCSTLLGVTDTQCSNYKFNLFSAWYAVQNERIFNELFPNYYIQFNRDFPGETGNRAFNDVKLRGWRLWAAFVGLGWFIKQGNSEILVPDATQRIQLLIPYIFEQSKHLPFRRFMVLLSSHCPELDGGILFEHCWQASRGNEQRGNNLSLMISTGFRTLTSLGIIKLIDQPDARDLWYLYPAEGSEYNRITHIEWLEG